MRLIILAAGQGTRLRPLTDHAPKCLVKLHNKPLLDYQVEAAQQAGIEEIIVVGGYLSEQLHRPGIQVIENTAYEKTNMVYSLFCAEAFFKDRFILAYGDIVYSPKVLQLLCQTEHDAAIVVDKDWLPYWSRRFDDPLSDAESLRINNEGLITSIGQKETDIKNIQAQYIGLMAFQNAGIDALRKTHDAAQKGKKPFSDKSHYPNLYMTDLLQGMIDLSYALHPVSIQGQWLEIDSLSDLEIAEKLSKDGRLK